MTDDGPEGGQDSKEFVNSLARGLSVLQSFGRDARRMTLSEVAERTSLNRAAARRSLLTLVELGFVATDGKYFELTPRVLTLGFAYLSSLEFWEAARPVLDAVSRDLEESCSAAVIDGSEIVYVARAAARHRLLSIALTIGTRLPAHATSMGQVLLAGLDQKALDRYFAAADLRRFTPTTLTARAEIEARLAAVRAAGHVTVDQEFEIGLRSIAVPIRRRDGSVAAALNVSTHAARCDLGQMEERFLPRLRQAADELSRILG
jgi:IclR family pca regulon transcriptional regulator